MTSERPFAVGDVVSIPSGNRRDPGRPHNHLVLAVHGTEVLIVPICTLYETSRDVDVVITSADVDVLTRPSFPVLAKSRKVPAVVLHDLAGTVRRKARNNEAGIREATAPSRRLALEVCRLLSASDRATPFIQEFIRRAR